MSTGPLSPTVAVITKLLARPDAADEVNTFLADAVRLANQEDGTVAWFALRTDTITFWIVDAFRSDGDRREHLDGAIVSGLLSNREKLLDVPPEIFPALVLAAKLPQ
jgi:quinol monooxygenase YgiN